RAGSGARAGRTGTRARARTLTGARPEARRGAAARFGGRAPQWQLGDSAAARVRARAVRGAGYRRAVVRSARDRRRAPGEAVGVVRSAHAADVRSGEVAQVPGVWHAELPDGVVLRTLRGRAGGVLKNCDGRSKIEDV